MAGYIKKRDGYYIDKSNRSELDYPLDWSDVLEDGETIVSAEWMAETGITAALPAIADHITTIWLSGGTLAATYAIACLVTTSSGRKDERGFFVQIKTPQQLSI
jgi:hypothetical protein